jgi:hypothetical protein
VKSRKQVAKNGADATKTPAKTQPSTQETARSQAATVTRLPSRMLTRMQAARIAGVSKSTIRRAEQDGELATELGPSGEHLIDEAQLRQWLLRNARVKKTKESQDAARGALAAQVFDRFDQGDNPVDVVKAYAYDPDRVEHLHAQWARFRGRLVLEAMRIDSFTRNLRTLMGVSVEEPIRSEEAFQKWSSAIEDRAAEMPLCKGCQRVAPTTCDACVQDTRLTQKLELEREKAHERKMREMDRELRLKKEREREDP